jgi:hypothetical protein
VKLCKPKQPPEPVYASRFFSVLGESITSTLVQYMRLQWQGWDNHLHPALNEPGGAASVLYRATG